ncbi:MAG: pentapeptide repeat-containing protein [candidate division Zixibacteria bacterium]|nr:pentapeptide repeat-containing protein [candidate division Zixibacteria bacterium]
MTSELSDKEKSDLKDIRKFNAEIGQRGWHVEDKLIEELDISGIVLNQSSLRAIEFSNVTSRGARITGSELKGVKFASGDFSNSQFADVHFIECEFGGVSFERSTFDNCSFVDCKSVRARMSDAAFRGCSFDNCSDESGVFSRVEFINTRILKPDWRNTSLYHARFDSTEITNGKLELVVFGNANIDDLSISESSIISCSFGESNIRKLQFDKCESRSASFGKANIQQLIFVGCNGFNGLNIINSDCQMVTIENCENMSEPKIFISRVDSLSISNCSIAYLYCVDSEFRSGGQINGCKISGANFQGAKMTGIAISDSEFSDYLVISNAIIKNLSLTGVTYMSGIEVDSQNVNYIESDRFAPL